MLLISSAAMFGMNECNDWVLSHFPQNSPAPMPKPNIQYVDNDQIASRRNFLVVLFANTLLVVYMTIYGHGWNGWNVPNGCHLIFIKICYLL